MVSGDDFEGFDSDDLHVHVITFLMKFNVNYRGAFLRFVANQPMSTE